jgi:hypothetical protein
MKNLTIKDTHISLPENWQEVTIRQFIDFLKIGEKRYFDIEALGVFTGLGFDFWNEYSEVSLYQELISGLTWINEIPNLEKSVLPEIVKMQIDGETKYIYLEPDLFEITTAKFLDAGQIAKRITPEIPDHEKMQHFFEIACIGLFPIAYNCKYDFDAMTKKIRTFEAVGALDILAIANFFLAHAFQLKPSTLTNSSISIPSALVREIVNTIRLVSKSFKRFLAGISGLRES